MEGIRDYGPSSDSPHKDEEEKRSNPRLNDPDIVGNPFRGVPRTSDKYKSRRWGKR